MTCTGTVPLTQLASLVRRFRDPGPSRAKPILRHLCSKSHLEVCSSGFYKFIKSFNLTIDNVCVLLKSLLTAPMPPQAAPQMRSSSPPRKMKGRAGPAQGMSAPSMGKSFGFGGGWFINKNKLMVPISRICIPYNLPALKARIFDDF